MSLYDKHSLPIIIPPMFQRLKASKERDFMSHVSQEILDIYNGVEQLTYEQWTAIKCNSFERRLLFNKLDDMALLKHTMDILKHCAFRPMGAYDIPATYTEAATNLIFPEVLHRFAKLANLLGPEDGEESP